MVAKNRRIRQTLDPRTPAVDIYTNVLYVDPEGDDALASKLGAIAQFKTIQAAIDACVAGDVIILGPGRYQENPVLKSGVNIQALERTRTIIQGNVSWVPIASPPTADLVQDRFTPENFSDIVSLRGLTISGTVLLDGRGKTDTVSSVLVMRDVNVPEIVIRGHASRQAAVDYWHGGGFDEGGAPNVTLSDGGGAFILVAEADINELTAPLGTVFLKRCAVSDVAVISGTAILEANETHFYGDINFSSSAVGNIKKGTVDGVLDVALGSKVTAPGTTFAFLPTGAGEIDRDIIVGTGTTDTGDVDTTVLFDVSRKTTNFEVFIQPKEDEPAATWIAVKSKSKTGFVVHDAIGDRAFSWMAVENIQALGPS